MDPGAGAYRRPYRRLRAVHIAGTKGKGPVAAMLDAIAREAGLRCVLYTKTHLVHLTERSRIDGAEMVKSSTTCVSSSASGFGTSRLPCFRGATGVGATLPNGSSRRSTPWNGHADSV